MKSNPRLRRWGWRRVLTGAVVVSLTMAAVAENVTIRKDVDVKPDQDVLSDPIETVPVNSKLQVLVRDHGWAKVKTPSGKTGFVSLDDLPPNIAVAGLSGNSTASGLSTSAAGKQLQPDAETYSSNQHLDKKALKKLIKWEDNQVTSKDLKAFDKDHHVGRVKYRQAP